MSGPKAVQQVRLIELPPAAHADHAGKHEQTGKKAYGGDRRKTRGSLVQQVPGRFQPVCRPQRDHVGDVLCQPLLGFLGRLVALINRAYIQTDQVVQRPFLQYPLKPESCLESFLPVDCTDFDIDALILCSKGELIAYPQAKLIRLPILHGHVARLAFRGRRRPPVSFHQFESFWVAGEIAQFVFIPHGFPPGFGVVGKHLGNRPLVDGGKPGTDHREQLHAAGAVQGFQPCSQRFHLVREHLVQNQRR